MTIAHSRHTATLLANGQVLIAGGGVPTQNVAELYDPSSGVFTATGSLNDPRVEHTASLLSDGLVLVAGGFRGSSPSSGVTQTAELYTPPSMPVAKIMSPINTATVGGTVNIFTAVRSQVLWINLYVDGNYLASSPPYNFSWDSTTVSNGTHTISIKAYDGSGQLGSDSISVNVANAATTSGAFVAITSPSNGATVAGTVTITSYANGPISWFNVYIDGNYLESSPPYTYSWDTTTVPNGSHTISITGNNNSGVVASNYISVTVANGSTPPPPSATVAIYVPANGATVSGRTTVKVYAQGGISWINLYVDGQYFASSPPHSFDWDTTNVANGSHTLSVRAYDTSNQQVGSNYITVNVSN